ncbi:MAG: DUF1501 domain-containing protein [Planctomycetes bacterium]|nr:DUF1501 domain-containing protein [Planctomycetota bacterium]
MRKPENTNGITRRDALKYGLAGAAGVSVLGASGLCAKGAPVIRGKAKSVIQIWMWGGPTHLDTFDPKPGAGYDYCGPYKTPVATNVDGIQICEMLPLLAKQADKYSIIRSMTHGINSHETASYKVQTGHEPGRLVYPSVGAVVSLFKGYDHGYKGLVPPYIVLTQPQGRFSEAGFLGQRYKPFATSGDPNKNPFVVEGIVAKGITDKRQRSRRELLHNLDSLGKAMAGNKNFAKLDNCEKNAYDMMFGDARKLFDLSTETDEVRQSYGRNRFGQSCLMARRLVEEGVPYVTINYKGWDTHKQHFQTMRRKLPELDRGMATLLEDISQRGLLDSTIVWWGGEFGRGPKIQWDPPWNGGRGHYGKCFNAVVAGGGFKGGHVVGSSNKNGTEVVQRPVYPQDMIGSIYSLLGIDSESKMPNPRGLDVKVLSASEGGGLLTEIM